MRDARFALRLLKSRWRPLLLFELVFKLSAAALLTPLFKLAFSAAMRLTGHRYLTAENVSSFLLHPITLLGGTLFLLLIFLCAMVDMGTVTCLLHGVPDAPCPRVSSALGCALRAGMRAFRRGSLLLAADMLLLIPFLHLGAAGVFIGTVRIPPFVRAILLHSALTVLALSALIFLLVFLLLRWLYAPALFLLEGGSFREARKKSALISKGNKLSDFLWLALSQLLLSLLYVLASLAGITLIALIRRLFLPAQDMTYTMLIFLRLLLLLMAALSSPVACAMIQALLRRRAPAHGLTLPPALPAQEARTPLQAKRVRALSSLLLMAAIAFCALFVYRYERRRYNLDIEHIRATEITAHRGASAHYPENTMAAFQAAWEEGADWIELDVRQSSDGKIYVMHDATFARTTGLRKSSWELTWEEISRLDAGRIFSPDFAGEGIPLLEDVIEFAKWRGIRLNIELKPTRHDTLLEQQVADIIRAHGFEDDCVVTCQIYSALARLKAYAPELTCVYVASVALGDISRLTAADHFSIEATFITRGLISAMHQAGKQVYAWTIDKKADMERLIGMGVDNIITNNVALGKQCVLAEGTSDIVLALLEEIAEPEEPAD